MSLAFLFTMLEQMGFGDRFLAMVRLLYLGTISWIGVSSHFSAVVTQEGGVWQGCSLSPLLYVLYLEPILAGNSGITCPGGGGWHIKVIRYADDATLFLTSERDFEVVWRLLTTFTASTGACIYRQKLSVLYVGAWVGQTDVPEGFSLCPDRQHMLGACFWRGDRATKNWDAALKQTRLRVARWAVRDLFLSGRVVAANCDLFMSLVHLAYDFHIPFWMWWWLERVLFSFIWAGQPE